MNLKALLRIQPYPLQISHHDPDDIARRERVGEDQQRRPPLQEELGAARRHNLVVAAEDQNRVRLRQLMIEMMVIPEFLDKRMDPIIHQPAGPCDTGAHHDARSRATTVSIASTASSGIFTTTPKSNSENSAARPALRNRAARTLPPGGGSSTAPSGASSTCTYTRLPFRVVTPQACGATGPPRVP